MVVSCSKGEILIRYMPKNVLNFTIKMGKGRNKLPREAAEIILWKFQELDLI